MHQRGYFYAPVVKRSFIHSFKNLHSREQANEQQCRVHFQFQVLWEVWRSQTKKFKNFLKTWCCLPWKAERTFDLYPTLHLFLQFAPLYIVWICAQGRGGREGQKNRKILCMTLSYLIWQGIEGVVQEEVWASACSGRQFQDNSSLRWQRCHNPLQTNWGHERCARQGLHVPPGQWRPRRGALEPFLITYFR